jgi:hypothetical protein
VAIQLHCAGAVCTRAREEGPHAAQSAVAPSHDGVFRGGLAIRPTVFHVRYGGYRRLVCTSHLSIASQLYLKYTRILCSEEIPEATWAMCVVYMLGRAGKVNLSFYQIPFYHQDSQRYCHKAEGPRSSWPPRARTHTLLTTHHSNSRPLPLPLHSAFAYYAQLLLLVHAKRCRTRPPC